MDVGALLVVIALVLAVVSVVDARPWLAASVILVCIALLVGDTQLNLNDR